MEDIPPKTNCLCIKFANWNIAAWEGKVAVRHDSRARQHTSRPKYTQCCSKLCILGSKKDGQLVFLQPLFPICGQHIYWEWCKQLCRFVKVYDFLHKFEKWLPFQGQIWFRFVFEVNYYFSAPLSLKSEPCRIKNLEKLNRPSTCWYKNVSYRLTIVVGNARKRPRWYDPDIHPGTEMSIIGSGHELQINEFSL